MYRFRFSGNVPETLEETERQDGKGARDFENSFNHFDAAETPFQFLDDVVASFDLHFQVAIDCCASTQLLDRFDCTNEQSMAYLRTSA
jgi:hypothetical protein